MKLKILGLLAVGLLAGPMTAGAVVVTISGQGAADGTWSITTVTGTFDAFAAQLDDQPWWLQDVAVANAFALAVGSSLGFPNSLFEPNNAGPFFAYETSTLGFRGRWFRADGLGLGVSAVNSVGSVSYTFALASSVPEPVPEPGTLALLGLGLAGLGLSRRRTAN